MSGVGIVSLSPPPAQPTATQAFKGFLGHRTAREGVAVVGWSYLVSGFRSFWELATTRGPLREG